jgi:hypothetical protein
MNYTRIENFTYNVGDDDEETIINWRVKHHRVQLRCPKCDQFFDIPKDCKIDHDGYASSSVYHFCNDFYDDEENNEGWVCLPQLVGYNER